MATNTYVALDTRTLGTSSSSVIFTGISQAYTDLEIVVTGTATAVGNTVQVQFNGDSTSGLYSMTEVWGSGSTASSNRRTNQNLINTSYAQVNFSESAQANAIIKVMNYSNSTTFKSLLARTNSPVASYPGTAATVGLWRNTNAITSITISGSFSSGCTFSLYGVTAEAGGSTPKAIGGTVTSDATYWYHTFTTSGNFIPNQSLSCDVLAIAGGGGSSSASGGGGAGGVQYATAQSVTATNYAVLIGAGGALSSGGGVGNKGNNTIFGSSITANGGGAGTRTAGTTTGTGGSGGGVANGNTPGSASAGTGGTFYGNAGAAGGGSSYGGGGGAGQAGQILSGGNGLNTWSSWASVTGTGVAGYYAGGGGPVQNGNSGPFPGGSGGGGAGGISTTGSTAGAGTAGTANTGGGAGGGGIGTVTDGSGAAGGSGIVIVRYTKA